MYGMRNVNINPRLDEQFDGLYEQAVTQIDQAYTRPEGEQKYDLDPETTIDLDQRSVFLFLGEQKLIWTFLTTGESANWTITGDSGVGTLGVLLWSKSKFFGGDRTMVGVGHSTDRNGKWI